MVAAAAAVTFEYVRERQERELWLVLMAHWISSWGGDNPGRDILLRWSGGAGGLRLSQRSLG